VLNDNIHCIVARTGLSLKRVKRMMYALNHQVFGNPVRCPMSLKSVMSFIAAMSVAVYIKRIHSADSVSIGIEI
jgi:hypothetical protein